MPPQRSAIAGNGRLHRALVGQVRRDPEGLGAVLAAGLRDGLAILAGPGRRMATFAPSRANASAVARPMPLLAPVTNATLPGKRIRYPSGRWRYPSRL
jgi:hypothetical protein